MLQGIASAECANPSTSLIFSHGTGQLTFALYRKVKWERNDSTPNLLKHMRKCPKRFDKAKSDPKTAAILAEYKVDLKKGTSSVTEVLLKGLKHEPYDVEKLRNLLCDFICDEDLPLSIVSKIVYDCTKSSQSGHL
jgi:hypothetical protein